MQAEDGGQRPLKLWVEDEARFGLQTLLGRRITNLGVKPQQAVQWPREAIWLYGVVAPATGESLFFEFSHLDTSCFEYFLRLVAQSYPDVLNVIQLDQAPAHTSGKLKIPDNVVLLYQPPHSPELNPTERVWEDLRLDFKGKNFDTLDDLRKAITEVLGYMSPEYMASLTQFPYIMRALSVSISS